MIQGIIQTPVYKSWDLLFRRCDVSSLTRFTNSSTRVRISADNDGMLEKKNKIISSQTYQHHRDKRIIVAQLTKTQRNETKAQIWVTNDYL